MKLNYDPLELHFHVTRGCNNGCYYCYALSGREYLDSNEGLLLSEMKQVAKEFSSINMPSTLGGNIVFNGGEPSLKYSMLLEFMDFCNTDLKGYAHRLHMISNGGLLGAIGNYRESNKELLKSAGLYDISPTEAIKALDEKGLAMIVLSVDSTHVSLDGKGQKVPFDSLNNCIKLFLQRGYGSGNKHMRFNVVHTGNDEKTAKILEMITAGNGFTKIDERNYAKGDLNIDVANILQARTGNIFAKNDKNDSENRLSLDEIFSFRCRRRSNPLLSEQFMTTYWQDVLDVDWDGTVAICQDRTFPIGNIREDNLTEILRRLNARENHPKYGRAIEIVHIYQELSSYRTWKNNCVGECLKLIHEVKPEMVENIRSDREACYTLGRNVQMQDILITQFHKNKDRLLEQLAIIDKKTEEELRAANGG